MIGYSWKWLVGMFFGGIIIGMVILFLYGQVGSAGDENRQFPGSPVPVVDYTALMKEIPTDVIISNVSLKADASAKYISGDLKNNGTKTFSATTINFGLFDTNESGLAEASTSAPESIEPGKVWTFYLIITNPDVVSYKLLSVDIS